MHVIVLLLSDIDHGQVTEIGNPDNIVWPAALIFQSFKFSFTFNKLVVFDQMEHTLLLR